MDTKTKSPVTAISLIRQFPYDEVKQIADSTGVDYKAKKLKGTDLMIDCIYAMLASSQVSQRILSLENSLPPLRDLSAFEGHHMQPVSHSSISERLDSINMSFFEKTYDLMCEKYRALVPDDYLDEMSVSRVDSTLVAETANKLKKGFSTGMNKDVARDRRQLKYTMAYDGLGVTAARVFTKPTYSADNAPISKVVHESLRKRRDMSDFYVFDRGLKAVEDFATIASHTGKNGIYFVGRLAKARVTEAVEDLIGKDTVMSDAELQVTEDYTSHLRAKGSGKWDMSTLYRIIKVRFISPRPVSPKGPRRHGRHYDEEMILITNNMEMEAITIAEFYRKRWDIEVFFKFLKQDLSFSHFISTDVHGIKVMLYLTLIVALLVKVYALNNKMGLRVSKLSMMNDIIRYYDDKVLALADENKRKDRTIEELEARLAAFGRPSGQ